MLLHGKLGWRKPLLRSPSSGLFFYFYFLRLIQDCCTRHTAGHEASCTLQCPTRPSPLCISVIYTCWSCALWQFDLRSCVQSRTYTMLMATFQSGSCCTGTCHNQFLCGSGAHAIVLVYRVPQVCLMWSRDEVSYSEVCLVPLSFPRPLCPCPVSIPMSATGELRSVVLLYHFS